MLPVGRARLGGLLGHAAQQRGFKVNSGGKPRLVILGTGWGSFGVLNQVDGSKFHISVVSPRNHLLFTPMLASSAMGTVNQRSICQPVRPVVAAKKGQYYEAKVKRIMKEEKNVLCQSLNGEEYSIPYDKLVIGVGFQPNDFNIPGVNEHVLFMKETSDATLFKDRVLERLEEASYLHALDSDLDVSEEEMRKMKELLTFIVVGGGPTGVELAAELTDFLQKDCKKLYKHLTDLISVHMFTYDVLNMFDKELQEYTMKHLSNKQHVNIVTGAFVQKVEKDTLTVKIGDKMESMKYGTLVWCAGIKPHNFIHDYGFPMNERKTQILTEETLSVRGESDIYALGDCATIDGNWLPQTAQVANQQAQHLAKQLNTNTSSPFVFKSKGMMAYLGSNNAIMSKLPGLNRMTGFAAFLGWRFTYWFLQISFRNRFMLATDWLKTLIFGRDLTRFGPLSKPE